MTARILIQDAADTGRFHPAVYRLDPLERFYPGQDVPAQWTLVDHHVTGVPSVVEAQEVAAVMAADAGLPVGVFPVIEVGESGDPTWVDHSNPRKGN